MTYIIAVGLQWGDKGIGHPIVGDHVYGTGRLPGVRQALHALSLSFLHPRLRESLHFYAPIPQDMRDLLQALS